MTADIDREAWALVTIAHPTGLHARPAVKLTKLAKGFTADVWLRPHGQEAWIDARSVVKVMGLKLRTGSAVELRAEGDEALAAVGELKALIERELRRGPASGPSWARGVAGPRHRAAGASHGCQRGH